MSKARWICFEGIGGASKTTQFNLLKNSINLLYPNHRILFCDEFSSSEIGAYLKEKISDKSFRIESKNIKNTFLNHLLVISDRVNSIRKQVGTNQAYDFIICDRFIMSDIVHLLVDLDISPDSIEFELIINSFENIFQEFEILSNENIFYIFFDIKISEACQRLNSRGKNMLKEEDIVFLKQLNKRYFDLTSIQKKLYTIDANNSREIIYKDILAIISDLELK